jgi:drug/metabolite transporter (DMT)-like permease
MQKYTSSKGAFLILLSSFMFGSYGIWSRLLGEGGFGVFYQGWTRALIIVLVLLPILYLKKGIVRIQKRDWKWLGIYLLFTSATQAPLFYAFNHMDIGSATLLFFVSMLLTMYAVGFFFLKERATWEKILSFLLALTGMYFVFSFSLAAFTLFAASMAVLNGIASGGEVAFSKKLSGNYEPLYLTWLSWLIIIPTNAILSLLLKETQYIPSLDPVWFYQIGYVIAGIVGFWAIIEGLKHVEASIGGLLGLLEIVFSIFLGILIFKEVLTARVIVGGVLIIFAAAFPHLLVLSQYKGKSLIEK